MTQESKTYPIGGYAPGNYFCKCVTCKKEFTGDKRAVQCEPCAVEMVNTKITVNDKGGVETVKQESIESAAVDYISEKSERAREYGLVYSAIKFGAKWQEERRYNEAIEFGEWIRNNPNIWNYPNKLYDKRTTKELFEQFKKK